MGVVYQILVPLGLVWIHVSLAILVLGLPGSVFLVDHLAWSNGGGVFFLLYSSMASHSYPLDLVDCILYSTLASGIGYIGN